MNANKKAVVTGGSDGIGQHCVPLLLNNGYSVVNLSRTPNAQVKNVECDLSTAQGQAAATKECENADLLLYCAGCSLAAPVEYVTEEDFRHLFEVNFFGFAKCVKAALPYMRSHGGKIGVISSIGGSMPIAFDGYYSAGKAALDIFVRELALELNGYDINVLSFTPGGVKTDFTFKRKVYDLAAVCGYEDAMNNAVHALAAIEQGGQDASTVANAIIKALLSEKSGVLAVDFMSKATAAAVKILPQQLGDNLTARAFDIK